MPFNTLTYFIFLPVVYIIFYICPYKFRWIVLLLSSYAFYAALKEPHLLFILMLVTAIAYYSGNCIARTENLRTRLYLLWCGIIANVLILVLLKYLPFIVMNLSYIINGTTTGITFPLNKTLITIGVSYYIFQAISYLIDIYLDIEKPELHLGYFALYMSFFPKLLQGPIERAHALIPQLHEKYEFNYNNMRSALLIITGGLFKKIVIADRLALYVNPVYNNVTGYSGIIFIITTYLYALQIYFEFSGYTDIALGTGRLFNIKLTQNFNSPYFANSVADFWRRWHISFSRWILDYIFKPMQMKLREWRSVGTVVAIIITFVISGVWHGASWCFIVWGLLHGLYLGAAVIYQPIKNHIHEKLNLKKTKILKVCQVMVTFHLVSFAWIFFRANNIGDAWYIVNHMLTGAKDVSAILISQKYDGIIVLSTSLIAMYILRLAKYKYDLLEYLFDKPTWIRWSYYYTVIMAILFFGVYDDSKFIYFQF